MQVPRVNHRVNVEQDIWIFLKEQKVLLSCCLLKLLSVVVWDPVPELGLAPVIVVD